MGAAPSRGPRHRHREQRDLRSHRLAGRSRDVDRRRPRRGGALRRTAVVPRRSRQAARRVHRGDRGAVPRDPPRPGRHPVRVRRHARPHLPGHLVEPGRGGGPGRGRGGLADGRRGLRPATRGGRPAGAVRRRADDLVRRRAARGAGRDGIRRDRAAAPRWRRVRTTRRSRRRSRPSCARPASASRARWGSRSRPTSRTRCGPTQRACPSSLQTPEKKADLIAAVASSMPGERHRALIQLAGWDEDDEVATALRPLLQSEDVFEAEPGGQRPRAPGGRHRPARARRPRAPHVAVGRRHV